MKGIEHDNEKVVTLPETLWIQLLDTELQDAVAQALKSDETAQEALKQLSDPQVSPTSWSIEPSSDNSSTSHLLFYNGRLYIPDDLDLQHRIVSDHHDTLTAGHLGVLATC